MIFLVWIVLNCAFAEPIHRNVSHACLEQFGRVNGALKELDSSQVAHCEKQIADLDSGTTTNRYFGPSTGSLVNFWKSQKCEELFSEKPPAWFAANSNAGEALVPWYPLCSLTYAKSFQQAHAKSSINDLQALINIFILTSEIDQCSVLRPALKTDSVKPEPTSSPSLGPVLSDSERSPILVNANEFRKHIADICCYDHDPKCMSEMGSFPIRWCEAENNCGRRSGYHITIPTGNVTLVPVLPFLPGVVSEIETKEEILLNPAVRSDGTWIGDETMLIHELGHACSNVRRKLMVKFDEKSSLAREYVREYMLRIGRHDKFYQKDSDICELSIKTKSIYQSLFRGFGTTQETFDCVLGLAAHARQTSFTGEVCSGCPAKYLEESFATWISLKWFPSKLRDHRQSLGFCTGARDDTHPLGPELLGCFIKTKSMRELLKRDLGCQ